MTIQQFLDNYDGAPVPFPLKVEVCPRCDGRGVHDAWEGGMTADEFHEQGPDFAEDYRSGVYDVRCTECDGRNVVDVIDRDACDPALLAEYDAWLQDEADYRAEREAERRMGA